MSELPTTPTAPSSPQPEKTSNESDGTLILYDRFRSQIEHEDDLINHRLSWLIASHSFLFAAYATVLVWAPKEYPRYALDLNRLHALIPWVGIISSVFIWIAILAAMLNTRSLAKQAPHVAGLPPILGQKWSHRLGLLTPLLVPPFLLGSWWCLKSVVSAAI